MPQLIAQQTSLYRGPMEIVVPEEHSKYDGRHESAPSEGAELRTVEESVRPLGSRYSEVQSVTAERLFHVTDTIIERIPTSVVCGELHEEFVNIQTCQGDTYGESSSTSVGVKEDILYGPLHNTQALQGYLLLCCQVRRWSKCFIASS